MTDYSQLRSLTARRLVTAPHEQRTQDAHGRGHGAGREEELGHEVLVAGEEVTHLLHAGDEGLPEDGLRRDLLGQGLSGAVDRPLGVPLHQPLLYERKVHLAPPSLLAGPDRPYYRPPIQGAQRRALASGAGAPPPAISRGRCVRPTS